MVYTTYLWWFGGWVTIVLTTLLGFQIGDSLEYYGNRMFFSFGGRSNSNPSNASCRWVNYHLFLWIHKWTNWSSLLWKLGIFTQSQWQQLEVSLNMGIAGIVWHSTCWTPIWGWSKVQTMSHASQVWSLLKVPPHLHPRPLHRRSMRYQLWTARRWWISGVGGRP